MIEENIKALFDEHIIKTRRVYDIVDQHYVFDNQIETAKEIIYNLYTTKQRWNLLFAEMQSGKSGTFFSIPYIISRNKILVDKLNIDVFENTLNVFLLTGMNEKELIKQFEEDIIGFTGMSITKNVLHNSEMRKFLYKPMDSWTDSDLRTINRMCKNSLILIDESHYGSDKNQILDKFLRNILNINPNGDNLPLEKNNIYVVSISATPMAEFVNANLSEFKKKIVPLKNSTGYYGITQMFSNNKIFNSYDLKTNFSVDKFLDNVLSINSIGYILVRCTDKQQKLIEKRIGDRMLQNLSKSIEYTQWSKSTILDNQGINDILYKIPSKKTIVYLRGLLRAGKRLDTKNIIMVHDTCISNVDTTVQSLLGRCCGYNKNMNISIFCDKTSAEKYKNWVNSGYDIDQIPDKSKNIISKNKNKFYLDKIEIIKYNILSKHKLILTKKRKSEKERKEIILSYINNKDYMNNFFIGSFYDLSMLSVKDSYLSKGGFLCLGDKDKEFNLDKNPINKYVITTALDIKNNTIEFSIGRICEQEIASSDKSMYHETNSIK